MKAIEAQRLSKTYGSVRALQNVSFSVEKGEVIGLLGPNGAGKTTLMKVLTGYLEPDEGIGLISGLDVGEKPLEVQSRIGYLPESAPLYGEMVVQEYLLMMAELRSIAPAEQFARLSNAVRATGIEDYLTRRISTLSKGYRQRVGIAQAILHQPEILILDEPTSGLDPTQIVEIRDLIKRLAKNSTVLLSTHILSEVEMTCERVLMIVRGELKADAPLEDLRSAQQNTALVAIEVGASGVSEALKAVPGVRSVQTEEERGGYRYWRVLGEPDRELCPAIFDALKNKGWRIGELRADRRNLEAVFRELAMDTTEKAA